jgi:hypothetical protein
MKNQMQNMDLLFINDELIVVDYFKSREFKIKLKRGSFIRNLYDKKGTLRNWTASAQSPKLGTERDSVGHKFSLVYSHKKYINYGDSVAVEKSEARSSLRETVYPEVTEDCSKTCDYYFLNPILFKRTLQPIDRLGALLYFTSAVKSPAKFKDNPHIKKFIPSNGARYPFTPLIHVGEDSLFKQGIYSYSPRIHALVHDKSADKIEKLERGMKITFRAVVERVMARYPHSIAYLDLLFDLGHLLETLKGCLRHYELEKYVELKLFGGNTTSLLKPKFIDMEIDLNALIAIPSD